jgi:uncharacterized BrkB/YihY/UPF0761 family membrane protein
MTWLYWTSFILLVGAELNAELAKESKKGSLKSKGILSEERERAALPTPLDHAA